MQLENKNLNELKEQTKYKVLKASKPKFNSIKSENSETKHQPPRSNVLEGLLIKQQSNDTQNLMKKFIKEDNLNRTQDFPKGEKVEIQEFRTKSLWGDLNKFRKPFENLKS